MCVIRVSFEHDKKMKYTNLLVYTKLNKYNIQYTYNDVKPYQAYIVRPIL